MQDTVYTLGLFVSPFVALMSFYRLWCLFTTKRIKFKYGFIRTTYALLINISALGFIYYGYKWFSCVWPWHCSEGFPSTYIAAGIVIGILLSELIYFVSEVIFKVWSQSIP